MKESPSNYRTEIDGLRAFAVLSVVAFHAFPNWINGGFIGVDIFFVISGFLITTHIFESLDNGQFSFTDFFGRRIRRIFPALILVMVCSLVFGWFVLLADEFNQLGKHIASAAAFVSNFIYAREFGYFDTSGELKPILHLWSLAIEEQFYIFWPFLLWLFWKLRQSLLLTTLIVMFTSFFVNIFWVERLPTEIFFWPFGRFWELLVGSILAWAKLYKACIFSTDAFQAINKRINLTYILSSSNKSGTTTFLGIVILFSCICLINKESPFPSYTAIFPVLGAVLVIIGGGSSYLAKIILSNKLAVWFGLISYPLYLWHWPILSYLHIIEDGILHRDKRILAVILAIFLAWITYQIIEKPIRFGGSKKSLRTIALSGLLFLTGITGLMISHFDFKDSNDVSVYLREGLEHRLGASDRWYSGLDSWLFLGNSYNNTVAKLKLSSQPSQKEIATLKDTFYSLSNVGITTNTKIAILVGPNKSSIYSEKLPPEILVSRTRYVNFFLNELSEIKNLTIYDPTTDFLDVKDLEGLLYYRTDTHWNQKGAFIAVRNLLSKLGYEAPKVNFSSQESSSGDLIKISKLKNFPLKNDDTWLAKIDQTYELIRSEKTEMHTNEAFGKQEVVYNSNPIVNKKIWIIGDSFANATKPFFEATFSEVHYLGHWKKRLKDLSIDLEKATAKPDLIVVVKVERSF